MQRRIATDDSAYATSILVGASDAATNTNARFYSGDSLAHGGTDKGMTRLVVQGGRILGVIGLVRDRGICFSEDMAPSRGELLKQQKQMPSP